jgi:tetratricopeptide (TPR) repeat protein
MPAIHQMSRALVLGITCLGLALGGSGCSKAAKRKRYLARANQDFTAERYDRAELEYRAVLMVPPPSAEALKRLGEVYLVEGKVQQAYVLLHKGLEVEPQDAEVQRKLAEACVGLRQFGEARELALRVLQAQPQDINALLLLAEASGGTNQAREVQQRLGAIPADARDSAVYHLVSGIAWLNLQQMSRAEAEFKEAVSRDAKSSKAYSLLGAVYLSRNDVTNAEQAFKAAAEVAPVRSAERLRYADWEMRTGASDAALTMVEEITTKAPDYVPAWLFRAQLAFAQQQLGTCSNLLATVLGKDPINLEGLLLKGNLLLASGEASNALAHFERMLQVYPKSPPAFYGMALAQVQLGQVGRAMGSLNQALVLEPRFADALMLLASLQVPQGDAYSAIAILKRLTAEQPQLVQAHLLLANAYLANQSPDEALAEYRRMAELFPRSPEVPMLIGGLLAQQGKRAEARVEFEKALTVSADYLPAVEQLVNVDLLEKKYGAATDRVQVEVQKHPAMAEPWLLMAKIHIAQAATGGLNLDRSTNQPGKLEFADTPEARSEMALAEQALRKAIELNPELRTAYLLLAQLYVASNQQQQALERLNSYVAKTNDVVALMQIGMIHEELKDYPAARQDYERLLSVNPRFGFALNNLAYLYSERFHELDKAYEMAVKSRELQPYDPAIADTLGWILYQRGEYLRALGLLEEAVAKLAADPEVECHLGMTCYMLGEEPAARTALRRAVEAGRDFPEKAEAQRRLALLNMDVEHADTGALAQMEAAVGEHPQDPIAYERLGELQARRGEYDKAFGTFQEGLRKFSQSTTLMLDLARVYFEQRKDAARALELMKTAHNTAPDDARVSRLLGRVICHSDQADYGWAASLLEEADRKLPFDASASYDLGWAYYRVGRVANAESAMRKAAQAGGAGSTLAEQRDAEQFLGLVRLAREPEKANADEVGRLLKADPGYVPALMVSAGLMEQRQDFQGAAQAYREALRKYPTFTPAARGLAIVCAEHPEIQDERAYDLAVQARESFPGDQRLGRALGILSYRRGEYQRVIELLGQGAGADDADALFYAGMAHYRLNEVVQGKAALQRALRLRLGADLAVEARRVLAGN